MDPNTTSPMQSATVAPPQPDARAQELSAAAANTEAAPLEKVLPQIKDLARQVGGYRKLIALLQQLDQGGN